MRSTATVLAALVLGLAPGSASAQRAPRSTEPTSTPAETGAAEGAAAGAEAPSADAPTEAHGDAPEEPAQVLPPGDDLPAPEDLSPLREELEAVMNDLVEARARVAVIGRQLFDTRVVVRVRDRAGRDHVITRFALRLDGVPIYQGGSDLRGRDSAKVFEGFAAPGPHLLTVDMERRARANEAFGYTQSDTYRVMVVQGMRTEIALILDDDSDMAEGFSDGTEGRYDVRLRMRVTARELGENE